MTFNKDWYTKQFDFSSADDRLDAINAYIYFNANILSQKNQDAANKLAKQAKRAGYKFVQTNNTNNPHVISTTRFDLVKEGSILERILAGENIREVISEAAKVSADQIPLLDVDAIIPDQKDKDRADGLAFDKTAGRRVFHGNGAPFEKEASKMANLITDPYKLVRRAKSVVNRWGTEDFSGENVWEPFRRRLVTLGFTGDQIRRIADYKE